MNARRLCLPLFLVGTALLAQAPPAPPAPSSGAGAIFGVEVSGPTRVEQRVEKLAPGSKLWVRNRNGAVKVSGWDRDEVALTAKIRDNDKRRVNLVLQRKGADLDIEASFQHPAWFIGVYISPRCDLFLQVPKKLMGHFRTVNGGVTVEDLEGYARCEATNGPIHLARIKGEVRVETTNGSVEARQLDARIKGSTTNGNITLEEVWGGIQLETTNGRVRARGLNGWGEGIRLESTNGSIDVELGKATGELVAENSNGSLEVQLPQATGVEVGKHSARAKVPGRSQPIRLETTNGGIHVH